MKHLIILLLVILPGCHHKPKNPLHDTPTAFHHQKVIADDEGFFRPTDPQGVPRDPS